MILRSLDTNRVNKSSIKAHLDNYNNNATVWTFDLSNAVIKTEHETINSDHLKIIAFDKKNLGSQNKSNRGGKKDKKKGKKNKGD